MILQIAVTRVLSVLLWYHWAFFSISLAMLGVGAPGVWFALRRPKPQWLARLLLGGALAVPLAVVLIVQGARWFGPHGIVFCMLALLPAVLCLGAAICLLLIEARGSAVGRMYAFDLLGACTGALLVVPLMSVVPTPQLCAATAFLPLAAYVLLQPRSRWIGLALGGLILLSIGIGAPYQVRSTKAYEETGPRLTPIYEKWTPTARLAIFDSFPWEKATAGFHWGTGQHGLDQPAPAQYWLEQDGSAGTPIIEYRGNDETLGYLLYDVTTLGLQLRRPARVAIVGTGGGRDIHSARLTGAKHIDAIELNAGIVEALRAPFATFSGGVYDLPGVHAIVGEARSVLTRTEQRYDLVLLSMIDSWAATAAGAYALSENNLYTLEAYRLYWSRLAPDGMVSTSRWMPFETMRLLMLVRAALQAEGVTSPGNHIALAHAGKVGTLLMSRRPFGPDDLGELRAICDKRGFVLDHPKASTPGVTVGVGELLEAGPKKYAAIGLHLDAPTDDAPFFFQLVSPLAPLEERTVQLGGFNAEGVAALQTLMITMTLVTLVLFFTPLVTSRWLKRSAGFWRGSTYFVCIGLAFMFVELSWLQRFILYVGHPSLAAAVTVGAMLLGAGLGSLTSRRVGVDGARRWGWVTALIIGGLNLAFTPLFGATLGWPIAARIVVAVVAIAPAGFAMGMFFPLGMVRFGDTHKAWFWALNGAAGVLASVASLALAMGLGFAMVGYLGVAGYVLAWVLFAAGRAGSGKAMLTSKAS